MQLVERIRQLEPARMAEVDRLMEKEQGAPGRGKELSLDTVSPETIATLTAMVDKEQARLFPCCHFLSPDPLPGGSTHLVQCAVSVGIV